MKDPRTHELKVRVPHEVYAALWSLRVVRGVGISETVTKALKEYLERELDD